MQEMFLGEAIKKRRLELGLTQEELCTGICEPGTLSRLENGRQTPSRTRINALLERLDMPADRYYALLSKNELEVEELQKQIVALNIQFEAATGERRNSIYEAAFEAHSQLETIMEVDDMVSRQLILRSKVLLGSPDRKYSLEEQVAMLTDAIRLTSPSFDVDNIGNGLYTAEEIKIINQLALVYGRAEDHMEAFSILGQLYKYMQKHVVNRPTVRSHLTMVAFNYSRELAVLGQYEKAIQIAEEGKKICLTYGHYLKLPLLIAVMAECYFFLDKTKESRDCYRQAYYIYKSTGDDSNRAILCREAKEHLGLEFED